MNDEDILDKILSQIGDFGPKQVIAFIQICVVIFIGAPVHLAYVFTAMDSDYRCYVPSCDNTPPEFETDWLKNVVPFSSSNKPAKCRMFSHIRNDSMDTGNCSSNEFDRNQVLTCESFVFRDNENYIGREFNLLCPQNAWKLTLIGSLNIIGMFTGLLMMGLISDKYGRKFVLLVGTSTSGITGLMKTYFASYESYCILEFVESILSSGAFGSAFILGAELLTPKHRIYSGYIIFTFWALGTATLPIVALLLKDWREIIYVLYGPSVLVILFYWSIPESIRWFLSKGELEKPKMILNAFAKANGKQISEESLEKLNISLSDQKDSKGTISLIDFLKSMTLLWRFINCCFLWISCAFLYYGLTLNSVNLSGNAYLEFFYISLAELPAYWGACYVLDRIGRRFSLSGSYFLTAVSCFVFLFISEDLEWLHIIVYCLGKLGSTASFYVIYVISSEVFPTPLRNTLMGICSMVGRVGSIICPQIPLLSEFWQPLPLVMFASIAALAGISTLFLPETLNLKLPDTIREAELIGESGADDSKENINRY